MARRLEYEVEPGVWAASFIPSADAHAYPGNTPDEKVAYLNSLTTATRYRLADHP